MFGLDPFSRPVAITEMLLLLALAAFIGWLLARLIWAGRISALQAAIADKENELEDCRRSKVVSPNVTADVDRPAPVVTPEPVATYVHADPLAPALTFDNTPEPVVEVPPISALIPETPVVVPPVSTTFVGNSEAAVLNRIAARADELNFDRIGRATAAEADDLKDIVGVGPFLERKLHSLGIYTFRQVANFTKEDIDKVNEIIEFFPGRIERDNWVEQSRQFYEQKYGRKE